MRSGDPLGLAVLLRHDDDLVAILLDPGHRGLGPDVDPVRGELLADDFRQFRVVLAQKIEHLDDGDFCAEAAMRLRQFGPDGTAADDD